MPRIISIANQKGGVGKTTTAINLGAALAEKGKKILIIDIDPQGNACSGIGVNKENDNKGIYEVLLEDTSIDEAISSTSYENLFIVPVNIHLTGAQIKMIDLDNREYKLKKALNEMEGGFDFVFIDCPPSLELLTINALVASDSVLIPLQCEYFALEGLAQLLKTINLVQKGLNERLTIEGVLLTMFDKRTNLASQVLQEATSYFKDKVYRTLIPRNIKLGEAPSFGKPITVYDATCIGSKSYRQLADEFIKLHQN